jgi:hypothetical protein
MHPDPCALNHALRPKQCSCICYWVLPICLYSVSTLPSRLTHVAAPTSSLGANLKCEWMKSSAIPAGGKR